MAGLSGATVAALATFIPCYLLTIIPASSFKKYGKVPGVIAFVDGITAAAIGAITGSVIVNRQTFGHRYPDRIDCHYRRCVAMEI